MDAYGMRDVLAAAKVPVISTVDVDMAAVGLGNFLQQPYSYFSLRWLSSNDHATARAGPKHSAAAAAPPVTGSSSLGGGGGVSSAVQVN